METRGDTIYGLFLNPVRPHLLQEIVTVVERVCFGYAPPFNESLTAANFLKDITSKAAVPTRLEKKAWRRLSTILMTGAKSAYANLV